MRRSTILRRLMTISVILEEVYFLLITVIYIFRPEFYTNALISLFGMQISEIPANNPDTSLLVALYGGVVVYFILWFVLKILMDKDANPVIVAVITFIFLPASTAANTYLYNRALVGYTADGTDAVIFHTVNFQVMKYCGWLNIAAFIFLMMAYAVCRQRFADLD